VIPHSSVAQW